MKTKEVSHTITWSSVHDSLQHGQIRPGLRQSLKTTKQFSAKKVEKNDPVHELSSTHSNGKIKFVCHNFFVYQKSTTQTSQNLEKNIGQTTLQVKLHQVANFSGILNANNQSCVFGNVYSSRFQVQRFLS